MSKHFSVITSSFVACMAKCHLTKLCHMPCLAESIAIQMHNKLATELLMCVRQICVVHTYTSYIPADCNISLCQTLYPHSLLFLYVIVLGSPLMVN